MRPAMKLAGTALATSLLFCTGCAHHPGMDRGMNTFGHGVKNLMLSPLMIVGGLAQGLAFLPYTIGMGLDDFNKGLREAQAVTMDDAYRATFKVTSIADPRVNRTTGQVAAASFGFGQHRPDAMQEATQAFQRLLVSQGMPVEDARHYVVAGDYSQTRSRGHILVSVVYRRGGAQPMRDEIVDWVGIEYSALQRDQVVATLMVLAAESVKAGKRAPDYWDAERQWISGGSDRVMTASAMTVKQALAR